MAYTQADRPFKVHTPLGEDVLLLAGFEGREQVSAPFHYRVKMLSTKFDIDLKSLLQKPIAMSWLLEDDSERFVHGYIRQISLLEYGDDGLAVYEAEMVPWLWFLHLFSNCRIFQNRTVPEIVEAIFKERGFNDFKLVLQGSYPKREYTVQYCESDFNFVSRLLEEEGIFYFFDHTDQKHILVLADSKTSFDICPNQATALFASSAGGWQNEDKVQSLQCQQSVHVGKVSLSDYDFEKPNNSLAVTLAGEQKGENYEYPGKYLTRGEGDRYARVRLEEQEIQLLTVLGTSTCRAFRSGCRFTLQDHLLDARNVAYTLLSIDHSANNGAYRSGSAEAASYTNSFVAIPNQVPFRPPRLARKPVMRGSQTAVVAGKSGEEIWVDKYGRVKVQFFWDREGQMNENSSCWIRVAQGWAGKQWGAIQLPRIGQEVLVDFIEGDPDRPLITGSVYNAEQMPPYTLPDEQTKATWKSMSSKGGGGFNEIRMEDKKGQEQIFIHAEKNVDHRVKNDLMAWTGNNQHLIVIKDQMEKVGGDKHLTLTGDLNEKVDGTVSLKAGMDLQQKVGMKCSLDAGTEIHIKAGMNLVIESGATLTLKVGGNFINLNSGGIFISGTMVMLNSGGAAGSGSGCSPQPPTAPTEAAKADPGAMAQPPQPKPPVTPSTWSPQALTLRQAARSGTPFCDI